MAMTEDWLAGCGPMPSENSAPTPRLVPDRPTPEMLRAAVECRYGDATYKCVSNAGTAVYESEAADDYAAMLAAAPPAEAPAERGDVWNALIDLAKQMDDQAARWSLESGDYAQGRTNSFCEAAYELREYAKRAPRVTGGRGDSPAESPRYVVLKASGSNYAYVNDTAERKTVKRYDIFKGDGWTRAKKHAAKLNELDALQAATGGAEQ